MENKDYSHLVNKEFTYTNLVLKEGNARLVNAEFDVGLTIIDADNTDLYLICMTSIDITDSGYMDTDAFIAMYTELFNSVIEMIEKGHLDLSSLNIIIEKHEYPGGQSVRQMLIMARNLSIEFNKSATVQAMAWVFYSYREEIKYLLAISDSKHHYTDLSWKECQDKYFELMKK